MDLKYLIGFVKRYKESLLSTPSTMIKTWAKLQPRTQQFLQELTSRNVDNLETLLAVWKKDKLYLLSAYQAWLPESVQQQAAALWPPL